MSKGDQAEAVDGARARGWTPIFPPNKKGYIKLLCPCGSHMTWLHKTPSNPNYFREAIQHLARKCPRTVG